MISLLDVNVLIALMVQDHPFHTTATAFFKQVLVDGWATCPLTENAVLRIIAGPAIPGPARTTMEIREHFQQYLAMPGHQFWPDDVSLADSRRFPTLPHPKGLTDTYLLGLAINHGGQLVTFDTRIDPAILPGARRALKILSPS